jgi:ABC-type metal ion transport system substrate-binding protein
MENEQEKIKNIEKQYANVVAVHKSTTDETKRQASITALQDQLDAFVEEAWDDELEEQWDQMARDRDCGLY